MMGMVNWLLLPDDERALVDYLTSVQGLALLASDLTDAGELAWRAPPPS
jgi:hypothetical protein